ncbi:immunoglobulin domain-containing protein [Alteromonas hispanica]|uniref:Uncharacterized protein n=1 Tax=Alteromonas hispanica TaxID=315421 RepID=A0A6L9MST7_9ALTE|nr:immunoglobulin domain-containing protein [Alteromonas hispanica]NDW21269.1 hypothetical protein [Alteromonas hispanica]
MTQITMRQGLWCHLQHEGHDIAVHCSLWSGKEVVYVDDHPVSEHRNLFRFTGRHALRLNDQDYTLEVEVENPFTYRTEVRLKKGARTVKRESTSMLSRNNSLFKNIAVIAGIAALGAVFGYFAVMLFAG